MLEFFKSPMQHKSTVERNENIFFPVKGDFSSSIQRTADNTVFSVGVLPRLGLELGTIGLHTSALTVRPSNALLVNAGIWILISCQIRFFFCVRSYEETNFQRNKKNIYSRIINLCGRKRNMSE